VSACWCAGKWGRSSGCLRGFGCRALCSPPPPPSPLASAKHVGCNVRN
jgi:hypothetical protein